MALIITKTAESAIGMATDNFCEYCNGAFLGQRVNQRFCSSKCQRLGFEERRIIERAYELIRETLERRRGKGRSE